MSKEGATWLAVLHFRMRNRIVVQTKLLERLVLITDCPAGSQTVVDRPSHTHMADHEVAMDRSLTSGVNRKRVVERDSSLALWHFNGHRFTFALNTTLRS